MARHKSPFGGGGGSRRDPRQTWELALAAHRAGDLEKAEKLYRSLLKLAPDQIDTLTNLGAVLERRGRGLEALKFVERALQLDPRRPGLHALHGRCQLQAGRPGRALDPLRRAVALDPRAVDFRCDLAAAQAATGAPAEAEAELRAALAADPAAARAWHDLGDLLLRQGRLEEAAAAADRLLELAPDQVAAWLLRGNIARSRGAGEAARAAFREAAARAPRQAAVWLSLGQVEFEAGHREAAVAAYREAQRCAPERAEPLVLLAQVQPWTERDAEFARLERLAKDPRRAGIAPHVLLFAHAKALADLGEDERAFAALLRANAAKRAIEPYDEAATRARLRRIAEVFSAERLAAGAGRGEPDPSPIFVVGMPRSSTSLVEQILASHPAVFGAGELDDLRQIVEDEARFPGGMPDGFAEASPEALRAAGGEYLRRLRALAPGALRVVDKSPLNSLSVGAIRCILPAARIVVCRRDPRDTCWSIFRHDFAGSYPFANDLAELGAFHRMHDALLDHWRAVVGPEHLLELRYEELVEDLDGEVRRLLAFVGLPFDPACLEFHRTERTVRTASAQQVKEPIFRTSIGAWQRHAARLGPLLDALAQDG
jgi:tetratricopeptide (TPR) repeat protein